MRKAFLFLFIGFAACASFAEDAADLLKKHDETRPGSDCNGNEIVDRLL